MKITVQRFAFRDKYTIGHLFIDEVNTGLFTLEDRDREMMGKEVSEWKVPGSTAIPRGAYNVTVTFSPHFQRDLPLLEDVPGFEGVRIHPGNIDADTQGCILVGKTWHGDDFIGKSRIAFDELFEKIKASDHVWIEIS